MNADQILEYETAVLWKIVLEGIGEERENDKRLRRMLRRRGLGEYDQDRIDALRAFKDDLCWELNKRLESDFHRGYRQKSSEGGSWDEEALVAHYRDKHAGVSEAGIRAFMPFAIYNYYLR